MAQVNEFIVALVREKPLLKIRIVHGPRLIRPLMIYIHILETRVKKSYIKFRGKDH